MGNRGSLTLTMGFIRLTLSIGRQGLTLTMGSTTGTRRSHYLALRPPNVNYGEQRLSNINYGLYSPNIIYRPSRSNINYGQYNRHKTLTLSRATNTQHNLWGTAAL